MPAVSSFRHIKGSRKSFGYYTSIFFKSFRIVFRSDRSIKMIHASFSNQKVKSTDKTIIKYRFRNALWYEFENVNTDERIFSIPSPSFAEKRKLIVHGLFRKKVYILNFDEATQTDSKKRFCMAAEKMNSFEVKNGYVDTSALVRN